MANKFLKRTLSVIMCVALIASMFAMSVSVLAEEAEESGEYSLEFDLTTDAGYNNFVNASEVLTTRVTNASITKGDDGLKYKDASETKQAMPIAYMPITLPEGSEQQGFELVALKSDGNTHDNNGQYIPGPSLLRKTANGTTMTHGFYFMIKNGSLYFRAAETGHTNTGNTWDWNADGKDAIQGNVNTNNIYGAKYVVTKDGSDGEVTSTNGKNIVYSITVDFFDENNETLLTKTIKLNSNNTKATGGDINGCGSCGVNTGGDPITITTTYGIAFGTCTKAVSSTQTVKSAKLTYTGTEAHIHDWVETIRTAANCENAGSISYTCSSCKETKTETIKALGHVWDSGVETKPATCTVKGEKTYTCTRCQGTKTETIATIDHAYDEGTVTQDPNCTETGVKTYTCTSCQGTKTETIAALGHSLDSGEVTTEATKTTPGVLTKKCTREGCEYSEDIEIPATGSIALKYTSNPGDKEKSFNDFIDPDANHAVANTNNKFLEVNADGTMQVKKITSSANTGFYSILDNQGTVKSFEVKSTPVFVNAWLDDCRGTFLGIVFDKGQDADGKAVYFAARFTFKNQGKPCIQVLAMQPNNSGNFATVLSCSNYDKTVSLNYDNNTYATLNALNSSYNNEKFYNAITDGIDYSVYINDNGETVIKATFNLKNGETPYSEYVLNADNINSLKLATGSAFSTYKCNYNTPVFGIAKVNSGNNGGDVIINEITAKYDRPTTEEIEDFSVSSARVVLDGRVNVKITVTDTGKRFKAAYTKDFGVKIIGDDIEKEFSNSNGDFTPNSTFDEYTCVLSMTAQEMSKTWTVTPYLNETDGEPHEGATSVENYSVKTYLEKLYNQYKDIEEPDEEQSQVLAKIIAVANYGAAAEKYFKIDVSEYANSFLKDGDDTVDFTAYENLTDVSSITRTEGAGAATVAGASLEIQNEIALVYYMSNDQIDADAGVTFTVDDVEYDAIKREDGSYRLATTGFAPTADLLGTEHTVVIKAGDTELATIRYSGYSYIYRMAGKTSDNNLKELLNAIVALSNAA